MSKTERTDTEVNSDTVKLNLAQIKAFFEELPIKGVDEQFIVKVIKAKDISIPNKFDDPFRFVILEWKYSNPSDRDNEDEVYQYSINTQCFRDKYSYLIHGRYYVNTALDKVIDDFYRRV